MHNEVDPGDNRNHRLSRNSNRRRFRNQSHYRKWKQYISYNSSYVYVYDSYQFDSCLDGEHLEGR